MSPFHLLFLAFVVVPLAEIYLLIRVGGVIGAFPTVALVVLTAVVGAALIRLQGVATALRVRESLDREELPAVALLEGAFLLVAGALLLTPGFVTDAAGFACLVPPLRRSVIERFLMQAMKRAVEERRGPPPQGGSGAGRVIEGDYRRED